MRDETLGELQLHKVTKPRTSSARTLCRACSLHWSDVILRLALDDALALTMLLPDDLGDFEIGLLSFVLSQHTDSEWSRLGMLLVLLRLLLRMRLVGDRRTSRRLKVLLRVLLDCRVGAARGSMWTKSSRS